MGNSSYSRPQIVASGLFVTGCLASIAYLRFRHFVESSSQSECLQPLPDISGVQDADAVEDTCDRTDAHAESVEQPSLEQRSWASVLTELVVTSDAVDVSDMLDKPWPEGPAASPLDVLVESGAHFPNITAVGAASLHGKLEMLQLLLRSRADPNVKCTKATSWDGAFTHTERDTALVFAAREGHRSCVEALLSAGADPNVQCESEYLEGSTEWGDDDDGTECHFYSALDVATSRQPDIAKVIQQAGGKSLAQPQQHSKPRKMISSGSRMGA